MSVDLLRLAQMQTSAVKRIACCNAYIQHYNVGVLEYVEPIGLWGLCSFAAALTHLGAFLQGPILE